MAKFCPECGLMGPGTAKFCSECGARITESNAESSAAKREETIYNVIASIAIISFAAFFTLFIIGNIYYGIFGFFAALFLFAWLLHYAIKLGKK
jgi:uncharacterized membrane protein YvbJ